MDLQFFRNNRNPVDIASWLFKYVAAGASLRTRATHIVDFLVNGRGEMKEGFEATCQVASRIAQRLDMPQAVQDALIHVFEQWDGRGMPYGIEREDIPVISRIVLVTSFLEVFHRVEGRDQHTITPASQRRLLGRPAIRTAYSDYSEDYANVWTSLDQA